MTSGQSSVPGGGVDPAVLSSQLANLYSARQDEHQTWFSAFTTGLTTNALLVVALFATGSPANGTALLCISLAGIVVSLVLAFVQRRAFRAMKAVESMTEKYEEKLLPEDLRYKTLLDSHPGKGSIGARPVMEMLGWLIAGAWFVVALVARTGP